MYFSTYEPFHAVPIYLSTYAPFHVVTEHLLIYGTLFQAVRRAGFDIYHINFVQKFERQDPRPDIRAAD